MDRLRLAIAIILATIVMIGWPILMHYIAPDQAPRRPPVTQQRNGPPPPAPSTSPVPAPAGDALAAAPPAETTQVPAREITISSDYWSYRLSNKGAVATSIRLRAEKAADGSMREITGADNQALELVPQDLGRLVRPLGI